MSKTPTRRKDPFHISEDQLQAHCVSWFRMQYARFVYCLFHPANGGSRNVIEAAKFKRMGVVRGVADLFLSIPSGEFHGFYIEMKVGTNEQTDDQIMFMKWARSMGYKYEICRSVEDFMILISDYMRATPWFKPTWKDMNRIQTGETDIDPPGNQPEAQKTPPFSSKWRKK